MFDAFKKLFGRKKTIDDLSREDLKGEQIRLEHEEKKVLDRIAKLEREKTQLFAQGKDETSVRQQRILARRIKDADQQIKNLDRTLAFFSQQRRVVTGFLHLKENQALLHEAGVSSAIATIDLQTLQSYITQASVDGEFQMEKFTDIVRSLEETPTLLGEEFEEDEDITAIMQAMQEARVAEEEGEVAVVEQGLKQVDHILHRDLEPSMLE